MQLRDSEEHKIVEELLKRRVQIVNGSVIAIDTNTIKYDITNTKFSVGDIERLINDGLIVGYLKYYRKKIKAGQINGNLVIYNDEMSLIYVVDETSKDKYYIYDSQRFDKLLDLLKVLKISINLSPRIADLPPRRTIRVIEQPTIQLVRVPLRIVRIVRIDY